MLCFLVFARAGQEIVDEEAPDEEPTIMLAPAAVELISQYRTTCESLRETENSMKAGLSVFKMPQPVYVLCHDIVQVCWHVLSFVTHHDHFL